MSDTRVSGTHSLEKARNLRVLRVLAVVLPFFFLATVSYLGHFVWHTFVHGLLGFAAEMAVMGLAVFLFSAMVFTLIERAENKALSQHQELLTLNTVAAAASQPMKLDGLLQVALDGVVEALSLDGGLACILDEKNQELLHVACRGIPDGMLGPLKRAKLEEGQVHTTVVRTGQPVQVRDMSQDPRFRNGRFKTLFRSAITLPLKSEGQVKGVMLLVGRSPRTFDASQVQFLLTLGGQLAVAIERAQLHEQVANMAVLEERERIAREMHDGLAQVLGYINAKTSAISRYLNNGSVEEARLEVVGLRDAAREAYEDVREAILGLRLASDEDAHLQDSLREYAANFYGLSGILVTLENLEPIDGSLDRAGELQVLRIVQEALTNVRKHAQATQATIAVRLGGGSLDLSVEDNGKGFDQAAMSNDGHKHYGLQTMRERAEGLGGKLTIESAPRAGTRVVVTVPVKHGGKIGGA